MMNKIPKEAFNMTQEEVELYGEWIEYLHSDRAKRIIREFVENKEKYMANANELYKEEILDYE